MQSEETKGNTYDQVIEFEGDEYDLKITVNSTVLVLKITRSIDQSYWEMTLSEEDFIKKDKQWKIFLSLQDIGDFLAYAFKKQLFNLKFSDEQTLNFSFKYQSPIKEIILGLSIPRAKIDMEKQILMQGQVIKSLKKQVKELADAHKTQLEEAKSLKKNNEKVYPVKIIEISKLAGQNTSYSTNSTSWTDIPNAKGDLKLENASKIKWQFYATSLYTGNSASVTLSMRLSVKNKANNQIVYWSETEILNFFTFIF